MDSSIGGWPGVAVLVTVSVTSLSFESRHQVGLQAGDELPFMITDSPAFQLFNHPP